MLVRIKSILGLFFQATKQIERNVVEKIHDALWEVIVTFECLIQWLTKQHIILNNDLRNCYLSICVKLGLKKLTDYVEKVA